MISEPAAVFAAGFAVIGPSVPHELAGYLPFYMDLALSYDFEIREG